MKTTAFYNAAPGPEITPEQAPAESPKPEIPQEDPAPFRSPELPVPGRFPEEKPIYPSSPEFPGTPMPFSKYNVFKDFYLNKKAAGFSSTAFFMPIKEALPARRKS